MDTSDIQITFNESGICNHCSDFFTRQENKKKNNLNDSGNELTVLFDKVKQAGRSNEYDCVIGVSGGVDSSTVLRLAVEYGLRVLAVHMDNSWNSPIAVKNIQRLVDCLGCGYVSYVLPWENFRKVQIAFLNASIPEVETPTDLAIQRALHHYAAKNGIRYILSGGNNSTEGILPISWHYNARDMRYNYSILKLSRLPKKNFNLIKYGVMNEFYMKVIRSIRTVYPLNFIDYEKNAAREILERDYGWVYYGSKHGESRFTKFIQNYYLFVKHGIDYRRATASSEICSGQLNRTAAILKLESLPYSDMDIIIEIEYVSKKLGITRLQLESIIKLPAKWYFEYPNNKNILCFIYDVYRLIYGKDKGSNF